MQIGLGASDLTFDQWVATQSPDIQSQVLNAPTGDVIDWRAQYGDLAATPAPQSTSGISTTAIIGVGLVAMLLFMSISNGGGRR